jgi:hypothetical protein
MRAKNNDLMKKWAPQGAHSLFALAFAAQYRYAEPVEFSSRHPHGPAVP